MKTIEIIKYRKSGRVFHPSDVSKLQSMIQNLGYHIIPIELQALYSDYCFFVYGVTWRRIEEVVNLVALAENLLDFMGGKNE